MQHIAEGAGTDGLERIGRRARAPTLQAAWFCVIAPTRCNNKPQCAFLLRFPKFWEKKLCNRGSIGEDTVVITAHCSFKCGPTKESHHFFYDKNPHYFCYSDSWGHNFRSEYSLCFWVFPLFLPVFRVLTFHESPLWNSNESCALTVSECALVYFWEQILQKASRLCLWIFRCVGKDEGRG